MHICAVRKKLTDSRFYAIDSHDRSFGRFQNRETLMSQRTLSAAIAASGEQPARDAAFFLELRKIEIAGQSYRGLLDAASEASKARVNLAYFILTLSLGMFAWYYNLATRADEQYEVLRHFVPALGLLACFVIMTIGQHRLNEECTYVARAIDCERAHGEEAGAGTTRAQALQLDNYWMPSRVDIACFCASIAWVTTLVIQTWYN